MNADDPRHGKRSGYLAGCRCDPCWTAHRRYCKAYTLDGRRRTVPAERAQEHVTTLLDHMTIRGIAEAAGVSQVTVRKVLEGGRIHARTSAKVLAVRPVLAGAWVPIRGITRRVQALNALGWSLRVIAENAGLSESELQNIANGANRFVMTNTADAIHRVYEDMSMRLPRAVTRPERSAVGRARNSAAARGFVPPLAWDDIDRDPHPITVPDVKDDGAADVEWMARAGESLTGAAARLRVSPDTLEARIRRAGRPELTRRLRANERSAA
jgi:transcriptional regulator with XRE-family HTH domain